MRKEDNRFKCKFRGNSGQVTIFIIIAIIIVAGVGIYLLALGKIGEEAIPEDFKPVYNYFLTCVQDYGEIGAEMLEERGGYIYLPKFEPGNEYRPFSSQLSFMGLNIPYWYYSDGSKIIEQVPSKSDMENQLEDFLSEHVSDCDFFDYELQGFILDRGSPTVDVRINENKIDISIDMKLRILRDEREALVNNHKVSVGSRLGKFYNQARNIYNSEKQNYFLERYAVDVLRLYAPVDGVELTCMPKVWNFESVVSNLQSALEANMQAVKLEGDYYNKADKYFVQGIATEESVRFLYSREWPTRVEVWPSENGILLAEPVGLQEGMGILGFCYVPYHFVYDLNYPVLVQIYDSGELFQFPLAVIIDKNNPREALDVQAGEGERVLLCEHEDQDVSVYTYDMNLEPVEARVEFKCLNERCYVGETKIQGNDAVLNTKFPRCVNGIIQANAKDYISKKYQISTNRETIANIIMKKLYELDLSLLVDGRETGDSAIIYFESEDNKQVISWPDTRKIKL